MYSIVIFLMFTMAFFFAACGEDEKSSVKFTNDPEIVPFMSTDSVNMLISDSGLIRYKMVAETWNVFEQAKEPFWFFPDGLYLEQFDTIFNVVVTIKSDTAWNYTKKKLWRLKGQVFVRNSLGETFSSEELFWNQQTQKIYSDKPVDINRPEKGILHTIGGFEANQQMTQYEFKGVRKSPLYIKEDNDKEE